MKKEFPHRPQLAKNKVPFLFKYVSIFMSMYKTNLIDVQGIIFYDWIF